MLTNLVKSESQGIQIITLPKTESPKVKLSPEKILNFRKATVPAPFDLKIDQIIQKRNKNQFIATQTYSSVYHTRKIRRYLNKKRNLYGALSPDPSMIPRVLNTCNPEVIRRLSVKETLSTQLSLKQIMNDNVHEEFVSVARQTYGRLKINLNLSPLVIRDKEGRWSPKLTVNDLAKLI